MSRSTWGNNGASRAPDFGAPTDGRGRCPPRRTHLPAGARSLPLWLKLSRRRERCVLFAESPGGFRPSGARFMPTASRQPASRHMKGSVPAEPNPCAFEAMLARIGAIRCRLEGILGQFLTLRISPPAHSETLPMRANGKRDEETHIENQSGPGEEGDEGVETSWRQFGSIFVVLLLLPPPRSRVGDLSRPWCWLQWWCCRCWWCCCC